MDFSVGSVGSYNINYKNGQQTFEQQFVINKS